MKRILSHLLIICLVAGVISCNSDFNPEQQSYPLISTLPVTSNDEHGVEFNGELIRPGTDPIIDYGFMVRNNNLSDPFYYADTIQFSLGTNPESKFSLLATHHLVNGLDYQVWAYASTTHETVYSKPVEFHSAFNSPTLITGFTPDHVLDADILGISGEHFNFHENKIKIGGKDALVLSSTPQYVSVVVPDNIPVGPTIVEVNVFFKRVTSDKLTITLPSITSFSPTHGPAGTLVTIQGRFSRNASYNHILFGASGAVVSSSSATTIVAKVTAGPAGDVAITANVNGKVSVEQAIFVRE